MIEFAIRRISETQYELSFISTGEGFALRYSRDPTENRWWEMNQLAEWSPDEMPEAGTQVEIALDFLALLMPDGTMGDPIEAGDQTAFKGITWTLDADGNKVWGDKWPGNNDGTGDAYVHTWETWPLPEEPDPEPAPQVQPFDADPIVAGDTGVRLTGTLVDAGDGTPVDVRWFFPDDNMESWYREGVEVGEAFDVFVSMARELVEGETIRVQSQTQRRADEMLGVLHPDPALEVTVDPAPEPVVQQDFVVAPAQAGDTGVTVTLKWVGPLDSVSFFVDGLVAETPAGEPGTAGEKFLDLGRTLGEGDVFEIYSVGHYEGRDSVPWPDPAYQVTVEAASTTDPDPQPEPGFPAETVAEFPENADEFYLNMPDGKRMKMGRLWKWLSLGWFGVIGVYIGKEE